MTKILCKQQNGTLDWYIHAILKSKLKYHKVTLKNMHLFLPDEYVEFQQHKSP